MRQPPILSKKRSVLACCFLSLVTLASEVMVLMAADPPVEQLRQSAQKLQVDGNYRDAYQVFSKLVLDPRVQGNELRKDLEGAVSSLGRLQQYQQLDSLLQRVIAAHPDDWQAYWSAASLLSSGPSYGFMVAGTFLRGNQRGGGEYLEVSERDRVQSLIWMNQARKLIPDGTPGPLQSEFYKSFASCLEEPGLRAWRFQDLTDLTSVPDYPQGHQRGTFRRRFLREERNLQGAPVDEQGNPIFISMPESFEAARTDGERWRWCLARMADTAPIHRGESQLIFANFLQSQFGVQTLAGRGVLLPLSEGEADPGDGIWSLPGLKEDETIAQLANGVKRFPLPEEFNFIRIFRSVADDNEATPRDQQAALENLGEIFANRQQYSRSAELLQESLKRFPENTKVRQEKLDQIIKPWGQFEPVESTAAGAGATVDFEFRNAHSVSFEAHRIKIPELLQELQEYIESRPERIDYSRLQIEQIGYQLVTRNNKKYLGEKVADWTLELEPRPHHFDRRVTVTTPLQQAGAYLVTGKVADGNTTRIILWLNDTAIIQKPIDGRSLYYVSDAATGQPLNHLQVNFFGWRQEFRQNSRQVHIDTRRFSEFTNPDGMILLDKQLAGENFEWLVTAKDQHGRFAYLGFNGIWYGEAHDFRHDEVKTYIITDRPVYRPDQKVQFKFWIREARYDQKESTRFSRQKFRVKINDPQGTEVFSQEYTTDEFGGLSGEYTLPRQAPLGSYQIFLDPQNTIEVRVANRPVRRVSISGSNHFLVEEYKKPEFEVTVTGPEKPVPLGGKIPVSIKAKYYYGAPVTNARVQLKVERSTHQTHWFPADPWDWLYGNGYWWFSQDSLWYPGFRSWGCEAPRPGWIPWDRDPPELVLDQEVRIGPDGTATIEIDTSLAKAVHGDHDHEYSITAEVTDASRRTIVGTGKVLVAREPFRIFVWTDRGHYQVGDKIESHFQARTLEGKGVAAPGELRLLKVTYKDGKPVETVVQSWKLETDSDGAAHQTLAAGEAGQYRLSFKLPSQLPNGEKGPDLEGGYLFVVRGEGFNGTGFEFNDLELITDQKNYAPGDKVRLMINASQENSTVLLFVRPVNGVAKTAPQVIRMVGKSITVELDVDVADMPNFFVEALTVSKGRLHDRVREITVPPTQRVLNVEIQPSAESYLPGENAEVEVKVTDLAGAPVVGAVALTVYDRALEYISGGSNVGEIRSFFWKWKRSHASHTKSNLQQWFTFLLAENEIGMQPLGVFGDEVSDVEAVADNELRRFSQPAPGRGGVLMLRRDSVQMGAIAPAAPVAEKQLANSNGAGGGAGGPGDQAPVPAMIRSDFADIAFWEASLVTDANGRAKVDFRMPENLSSWKIRAWGMGAGTDVGESTREVVTAKNLIVRLQAPRFFVEKDEVVLSAVVHNDLKTDKQVQVQLELAGGTLELIPGEQAGLSTTVSIPAHGEKRIDWRVKVVQPGKATVTMKALTDEESDAMQMTFPVIVHGILKTESFSGVIRPDADSSRIEFTIPEDREPEQSRIEVRYSPTLAGAMVDALPYLASYPYGCTEQTLNRFVPAVITQRILQKMGLDLKAIQEKRTNLNAQQLGDPAERAKQWKQFDRNPVFDADELALMVKTGVADLVAMQNDDGGWGWFSGFQERSYPHSTSVVVHGLQRAVQNGLALPEGVLEGGVAWLKKYQDEQVLLLQEGERHAKDVSRKERFRAACDDLDALVFSVLVDAKGNNAAMQQFLYRDRLKVSPYSQALLGLALHELGAIEQRDMIVRNLDQFLKVDDENQTAYLDLPNGGYWWYWYGNSMEANAQYLKLLTRVDVNHPGVSGLVKYLVNNRRNGAYWNSTRDTAYCIEALADYLVASGEGKSAMSVEVWLDGQLKQTVEMTPENLFTFNNRFVVEGLAVTPGKHTLELRRTLTGGKDARPAPLYFNAYVTNFTKEDPITATGLEIKVGRKYYRLVPDRKATQAVAGDRGQVLDQLIQKYQRVELKNLDEVHSGDLIEVELEIDSKNDYEYVVFEDMKLAGSEPVDLRSGYTSGGLGAYVEYRDQKVAFFLRQLSRGKHSVSYRVRAEIPGIFSALPTQAQGMYAPELRANAEEMKLKFDDLPEPAGAN